MLPKLTMAKNSVNNIALIPIGRSGSLWYDDDRQFFAAGGNHGILVLRLIVCKINGDELIIGM